MTEFTILGAAGAIGRAVGAELARRGVPFRVVGRSRTRLKTAFPGAEVVEADLADPAAAATAVRDARIVIHAVGVPYPEFRLHPILMRNVVATRPTRLVVVSSVYSYGRPKTATVAETHPREPEALKGRMRKEQEDIALDAGGMVIHLPDFYGPHADLSLANPIFRAALDGKRATWLGPVDKPHEFLFVPDIAPMIIELAQQDDCYGQRWNFAGAGTITPRLFITGVYRAAGRDPKWRSVSKIMLRLAGLFSAFMRELPEMYYLQETPVILDDAKLRRRLGAVHKTPYEEGIRQTFAWLNAMP